MDRNQEKPDTSGGSAPDGSLNNNQTNLEQEVREINQQMEEVRIGQESAERAANGRTAGGPSSFQPYFCQPNSTSDSLGAHAEDENGNETSRNVEAPGACGPSWTSENNPRAPTSFFEATLNQTTTTLDKMDRTTFHSPLGYPDRNTMHDINTHNLPLTGSNVFKSSECDFSSKSRNNVCVDPNQIGTPKPARFCNDKGHHSLYKIIKPSPISRRKALLRKICSLPSMPNSTPKKDLAKPWSYRVPLSPFETIDAEIELGFWIDIDLETEAQHMPLQSPVSTSSMMLQNDNVGLPRQAQTQPQSPIQMQCEALANNMLPMLQRQMQNLQSQQPDSTQPPPPAITRIQSLHSPQSDLTRHFQDMNLERRNDRENNNDDNQMERVESDDEDMEDEAQH